ncbi:unnamed protein product [Paramecium pentaurelia]|uniref:EXS family protein n=1 Tax=Paramecium pentaurelia TaxID=43138 RepID=A0A8S1V0G5_9CILI|nr:unnamed protein product [Paramecium pentaurelia]
MKFAKLFLNEMIPEWIKLYLNYKLLKTQLSSSVYIKKKFKLLKSKYKTKKKQYKQEKQILLENELVQSKIKSDLQGFCVTIKEDLIKIQSFIIWKYQDIQKKNTKVQEQIKLMKKQLEFIKLKQYMGDDSDYKKQMDNFKEKQYILKQTIYQFYIEILQYKSFVTSNHQGLIKILKKYKKWSIAQFRDKQFESLVLSEVMNEILILKKVPDKCSQLLNVTERLLLNNFYALNPKKGRYNLRKYQQKKTVKGEILFKFGLFIGFALVLLTFIFLLRIEGYIDPDNDQNQHSIFQKMFPCFRGLALFIIYYWYLALDLWGWTHFRINYKIYLGFNHHFSTVVEVFKRVSYFSTMFLLSFVFYSLQAENIEPFQYRDSYTKYIPLVLWCLLLLYIFFPFTTILNGPGRVWLYKILAGAVYGHFIKYESRFTFCLDQFISMAIPLRDLDYTICYYKTIWQTGEIPDNQCFSSNRLTGALIAIIPFSMKTIHYLTRARDKGKFWHTDEMWNFFKTLLATWVAVLSFLANKHYLFRIIWIPFAAFCSLFQYWWDLKKDWLFFEEGSNVRFLRNDLGYNHPCIYYFIGISNFFLRLTWILTVSPNMYLYLNISNKEVFIFIIGFLEMTRRLINNFIKIEKEYITNLRSLKTTRDLVYPFVNQDKSNFQDIPDRLTLSVLNLNEQDKQDEDLIQLFRATTNLLEKSDLNKSDYLFQGFQPDMEILERAKKQEKFQESQIRKIKQENKDFKAQLI